MSTATTTTTTTTPLYCIASASFDNSAVVSLFCFFVRHKFKKCAGAGVTNKAQEGKKRAIHTLLVSHNRDHDDNNNNNNEEDKFIEKKRRTRKSTAVLVQEVGRNNIPRYINK
mmetsp:Transcript_36595/g.40758  ORF Transcript_36595/g.40758 Transcript_36595/m.40758 type:complete len:113 (+) Transcript_36595:163-501(+)